MSWKMCALFVLLVLLLTACAAGSHTKVMQTSTSGELAGFYMGFWHGVISPFAWSFSVFNPSISIYEVHNNGGGYNFGFLLGTGGVGSVISCAFRSSRRTSRRTRGGLAF